MKRLILLALFGSALLTGCARHYVMTLNNGTRVTTVGKPRLEGNSYVFKDAGGQPGSVPAGRVRDIAPASMVADEKPPFSP